jgi:hypothetical protein
MLAFLLPFLVNELFAGSMIFTDRGSNELRIADLDGSNVRTLISAAGTNVRGVAIDTATEQLFYADNGGNIIYRTQLDGSIQVFKLLPDTVSSSGTFLRLRLELITQ